MKARMLSHIFILMTGIHLVLPFTPDIVEMMKRRMGVDESMMQYKRDPKKPIAPYMKLLRDALDEYEFGQDAVLHEDRSISLYHPTTCQSSKHDLKMSFKFEHIHPKVRQTYLVFSDQHNTKVLHINQMYTVRTEICPLKRTDCIKQTYKVAPVKVFQGLWTFVNLSDIDFKHGFLNKIHMEVSVIPIAEGDAEHFNVCNVSHFPGLLLSDWPVGVPLTNLTENRRQLKTHHRVARSATSCQKHNFVVRYDEIGWHFVVGPQGSFINYCAGQCDIGVNVDHYNQLGFRIPNHLLVRALYSSRVANSSFLPEQCCVPEKLGFVNVLATSDQTDGPKHRLQTLTGITAESCACL